MTTYLQTVGNKTRARTNHAFVLYGATRDLQLGINGSCSLVDHLIETFALAKDDPRLVAVYRVGIGWRFPVESDRAKFARIALGESAPAANSPFAGLAGNASADDLPIDTASAIGLIDAALRQQEIQIVCVIDRAELVAPNASYDRMSESDKSTLSILQALASDPVVGDLENLLFLVTDVLLDLHESLRLATSRYAAVEIVPPDFNERLAIAEKTLPQLESANCNVQLSAREFAIATSMLSRYGIMDVLQDALAAGELTRSQVRAVKNEAMAQEYGEVIEVLDPLLDGFAGIAGMGALKEFFTGIIGEMVAGEYSNVPTGILCAGAAGLGKSYFVKGIAGEFSLPVINFNLGKLLGSYVGQSERNLERAITAIRSAQPCIVMIDEIESAFPNRANGTQSGDSGVSNRILKRMLEVLSDPSLRGRVLWIGITNYPQQIDAALARAGRFDVTVAFVPPSAQEIAYLIEVYSNKFDLPLVATSAELERVAEKFAGYTNAEIETVARKVKQLYASNKIGSVFACWIAALSKVRSNTRGVEEMTKYALLAVNDSDLLPVEYIEQWKRITNQASDPAPAAQRAATNKPF
jgi:transitional endoplasmic reticulum ATPase